MKRYLLLFFLLVFNAYGKPEIIWPYVHYPPLMIIHQDKKVSGVLIDLYHSIFKKIPSVNHKALELPINRVMQFILAGQNICTGGLNWTERRDKILFFSKPYSLGNRHYILYSKRVKDIFKNKKAVDLEELIKIHKLKLVIKKEISYGPYIDRLIKKYAHTPQIVITQNAGIGDVEMQMVRKNRGDITIGSLPINYYLARLDKTDEFGTVEILKGDAPNPHHIACTKNEIGEMMIKRINKVLAETVVRPEFFRQMSLWVHEANREEFKELFKKRVIKAYK